MKTLSILPIDIGFDLRKHDISVDFPSLTLIYYLDKEDNPCTLTTQDKDWTVKLLQAGYTVNEKR
jgi:hypothetical protein